MKKLTVELPAMYGDHHVTEVRRLVLELPGIQDVYASSAFQVLEVTFDPAQTAEAEITARLDAAGYLGDLMIPVEMDTPSVRKVNGNGNGSANGNGNGDSRKNGNAHRFRHTTAYTQLGSRLSFKQVTPYMGRPLWPCPGMGPLATQNDEE